MGEYHFYHPMEVRYGDLDPQGHVNNAAHLTYFEQARVAYFIKLGLFSKDQSFMDIGVILADVQITYLKPVTFGREVKVGVRVEKLGGKSITLKQNVLDGSTGEELSRGKVVMVTFDYREGKTIPIPEEWRRKVGEFEKFERIVEKG